MPSMPACNYREMEAEDRSIQKLPASQPDLYSCQKTLLWSREKGEDTLEGCCLTLMSGLYGMGMPAPVGCSLSVEVKSSLWESVLSYHHVGLRD